MLENTVALKHKLDMTSRVLHYCQVQIASLCFACLLRAIAQTCFVFVTGGFCARVQHILNFVLLNEREEHTRVAQEEAEAELRAEEESRKAREKEKAKLEQLSPSVLQSYAFTGVSQPPAAPAVSSCSTYLIFLLDSTVANWRRVSSVCAREGVQRAALRLPYDRSRVPSSCSLLMP